MNKFIALALVLVFSFSFFVLGYTIAHFNSLNEINKQDRTIDDKTVEINVLRNQIIRLQGDQALTAFDSFGRGPDDVDPDSSVDPIAVGVGVTSLPYPPEVVDQSADLIIQKVGQDNFDRLFVFSHVNYEAQFPTVSYNLSQFDSEVRVNFNTDWTIITQLNTLQLPNCIEDNYECVFLSEGDAIAIAESEGLDQGIEPWLTNFRYATDHKTYVFSVVSTIEWEGNNRRIKLFILDANSGRVIDRVDDPILFGGF